MKCICAYVHQVYTKECELVCYIRVHSLPTSIDRILIHAGPSIGADYFSSHVATEVFLHIATLLRMYVYMERLYITFYIPCIYSLKTLLNSGLQISIVNQHYNYNKMEVFKHTGNVTLLRIKKSVAILVCTDMYVRNSVFRSSLWSMVAWLQH